MCPSRQENSNVYILPSVPPRRPYDAVHGHQHFPPQEPSLRQEPARASSKALLSRPAKEGAGGVYRNPGCRHAGVYLRRWRSLATVQRGERGRGGMVHGQHRTRRKRGEEYLRRYTRHARRPAKQQAALVFRLLRASVMTRADDCVCKAHALRQAGTHARTQINTSTVYQHNNPRTHHCANPVCCACVVCSKLVVATARPKREPIEKKQKKNRRGGGPQPNGQLGPRGITRTVPLDLRSWSAARTQASCTTACTFFSCCSCVWATLRPLFMHTLCVTAVHVSVFSASRIWNNERCSFTFRNKRC